MRIFKVASIVFLSLIVQTIAWAIPSPMDMLQSTSNEMLAALKQNQASMKANQQLVFDIVHRILLPHVDLDRMSRTALGRDVWLHATPKQKAQFKDQFTTMLIRTYASALASYTDQAVQFFPIRGGISAGQTQVQVMSQITQRTAQPVQVSYNLVFNNGAWKVYDFAVDGVSITGSFNAQFASELQNGNLDVLIQKLTEHNKQ